MGVSFIIETVNVTSGVSSEVIRPYAMCLTVFYTFWRLLTLWRQCPIKSAYQPHTTIQLYAKEAALSHPQKNYHISLYLINLLRDKKAYSVEIPTSRRRFWRFLYEGSSHLFFFHLNTAHNKTYKFDIRGHCNLYKCLKIKRQISEIFTQK